MAWLISLLDISLATANRFYAWGWGLSASGAAITVLGIGLLWWGTRVRDHDFEENIAGLHTKAGVFEKDAAEARKQTAELQKEAAKIQLNLEQARIARLQLEEKQTVLLKHQTQRSLTDEQKRILVAAIAPFRGQKIAIWTVMEDADGNQFATDFVAAVRAAGWDDGGGTGINQGNYGGSNPVGVEVYITGNDTNRPPPVPPAAEVFIAKLVQFGIMPSRIGLAPDIVPGTIKLSIGIKAAIK